MFPHRVLFLHLSGQVRSGQVRVFNVHIQSKLLAHACHGHRYRPSPGQEKRWEGVMGGGGAALAGTKEFGQSDRGR